MKWKNSTIFGGPKLIVAVAGALLMSGGIGLAQSEYSASRSGLEGTWIVQVTLRNCASNAALGTFNSLVSFHRGGTMSENASAPVFAVGQRSSGHGTWSAQGDHTYSQRMVNLINFDTAANLPGTPGFDPKLPVTPGFSAGWSTVTHTIELLDADHATSSGTNDFYRFGETTPYRSGCSTSESARFE